MTTTGPTTSTTTGTDEATWASRRALAFGLQAFLFLAPVAVSVAVAVGLGWMAPRPSDLLPMLGWFAGIVTISTVALRLTDRALRRFTPAVALLRLSLVFPDRAPSRFRLALRSGTVNQLRRNLDDGSLTATPQSAAESLIALTSQLGRHDRLTRGHSERVRAYSALIADELELEQHERDRLQWAALLHDIGKLDVPAEILNKDGRPTDEEWKILQGHPAAAERHLGALADWLGEWVGAATQHHERWDGGGYPAGLAGEEISLAGRIVAVADAYDTMVSVRSYKNAMSPADARAEITHCSGGQFDPTVVKAFLAVSLRDLRRVTGPVAWLAQVPILLALPSAAASPVVSGALVASVAVAGVTTTVPLPVEPAPENIDAAPLVIDMVDDALVSSSTGILASLSDVLDGSGDQAGPSDTGGAAEAPAPDELAFIEPIATPTATPRPQPTAVVPLDETRPPALGRTTPTPTPIPTLGTEPGPIAPPTSTPSAATPTPLAQVTATPTPSATPAPSPTPDPTSTPTPTPSPTPFVLSVLYLANPGADDTASSPTLPLVTSQPTAITLANYDTDRDADEGLRIRRSAGFATAADDQRQTWSVQAGAADLPNAVQLRVVATLEDYERGSGDLEFVIRRCSPDLFTCELLGFTTKSFSVGGSGGFRTLNTTVALSGDLTASMPTLALTVVALDSSDADVWLAYDTVDHDARIRF